MNLYITNILYNKIRKSH